MKITGSWFEIHCKRVGETRDIWSVEYNRDDEIRNVRAARDAVSKEKQTRQSPHTYRIVRYFEMSETVETIP